MKIALTFLIAFALHAQPTTGTWTHVTTATGYTSAEVMGYEATQYISTINAHCYLGSYKLQTTSEANTAVTCYSYAYNRWDILQHNGYWRGTHNAVAGHSQQAFAYDSLRDSIWYEGDGASASEPGNGTDAHWFQVDIAGLSGRERQTALMPWMGGAGTAVSSCTYDSANDKVLCFGINNSLSSFDPTTNAWTIPTVSSGSAPSYSDWNTALVYDVDNGKAYLYGGLLPSIYSVKCDQAACTSVTWVNITTTCSGAGCVSTHPATRTRVAMAYSPVDHILLMAAGADNGTGASTGFTDTWIFDPATAIWTQQSPGASYTNPGGAVQVFDRMSFDSDSNVFVMVVNTGGFAQTIYVFPYSAATHNFGYASPTIATPAASLNVNGQPPSAATQTWAYDAIFAAGASNLYAGWVESGNNADNTVCGANNHAMVVAGTTLAGLAQLGTCLSISSLNSGTSDSSRLQLAEVNGTLWESHEEYRSSGISAAQAKSYSAGSWSGGPVGCIQGSCAFGASGAIRQFPAALIAVGTVPTLAAIESNSNHNASASREQYLYIQQYTGSWSQLGTGIMNINAVGTGTRANAAALATDGTNPAACWTEDSQGSTDRVAFTITPQLYCKSWNGSTWAQLGSTSLNQSTSAWAYDPAMTYMAGNYYIAWVERSTAGVNKLYVCKWTGSACTLLGGGALNINTSTGWATHPSLANDGTNVYLSWEEQTNLGQHPQGYIKKWGGATWAQVGNAIASDTTNGSVYDMHMAILGQYVFASWSEQSLRNLRQVYARQVNGDVWPLPSPVFR